VSFRSILNMYPALIGAVMLLASASSSHAQDLGGSSGTRELTRSTVPMAIHRLTGSLDLDGVVNEAAWDAIEPLPMFMYAPVNGGQLTENTEVRIAYDEEYLYMSGRMYDSDPDGVRANTFYRDQFSGDDLLSILIDSYNDYETAVWFVTNPSGARSDRTMSNDAQFGGGGFPMNSDWNAHWDVWTSRSEEGWFAEFRIPLSTLGFQAKGDEVTMGIIIYRFIARKGERHLFPAISDEWGGFGFAKPSQAQRVTLRGVQPSKPVYVTPYLLGGGTQTPVLREPPGGPAGGSAGWDTSDDFTTEPGLDLKYSPSSNLALDLTVNTDFAQVEADDQQINLTRFSLFFPEKRQFFQERASTFAFNTGGFTDRLFFSRRIGLNSGQIVRIYGGARVVGRAGGMDFGFLTMQTAPQGGRAGENAGVLRLNQQVFNPYSSIGGMLTTRYGSNGENNVAYGVDADIRLFGDEYVTLQWAQTFDEAIEEGSALDAGLLRARWERRIDRGLSYVAEYRRVGPDYLPRLGFQLRDDFSSYRGNLSYTWYTGDGSALRNVTLSGDSEHLFRNADDTPESRFYRSDLRFEFRSTGSISLGSNSSFESIRDGFQIAELSVEPGEYWFHNAQLSVMLPRNGLFRGAVNASAGTFFDGTRYSAGVSPTWNVSQYLEVGGGYDINRINFAQRGIATTTHLGRLRFDVALNTHLSLSTFAQYNSLADLTTLNARFRYHFREGTDLWIVYNEGYNVDRDNGFDPRLPLSAGRTLMVKYSHTFTF